VVHEVAEGQAALRALLFFFVSIILQMLFTHSFITDEKNLVTDSVVVENILEKFSSLIHQFEIN
jgi:hypothetical protein